MKGWTGGLVLLDVGLVVALALRARGEGTIDFQPGWTQQLVPAK